MINNAKRVQIKILKGILVVRVGGGYVSLEDYIQRYIINKRFYKRHRNSSNRNSSRSQGLKNNEDK